MVPILIVHDSVLDFLDNHLGRYTVWSTTHDNIIYLNYNTEGEDGRSDELSQSIKRN